MLDGNLTKILWLAALSAIWGWLIGFYMGSKRARLFLEALKKRRESAALAEFPRQVTTLYADGCAEPVAPIPDPHVPEHSMRQSTAGP